MARHEILGGLVQLYKRNRSRYWQCSASYRGRQFRASTKEEDLPQAKQYAEDWFLEIRGKSRAGLIEKREPTIREAAEAFTRNTRSSPRARSARNGLKVTKVAFGCTFCRFSAISACPK